MIRHDTYETMGLAAPAFRDGGFDLATADAWDDPERWPSLREVSGIVMFGGAMNVDAIHRLPSLGRERELTREAIDRGVPFLGICLGAQMLARALDVEVVPAPVKEIGFTQVSPTAEAGDDPLLHALQPAEMVFHWHEDTFVAPPDTTLLATGEEVRVQALRAGERAWGVQFHFEVDRRELDLWLVDAGEGLEDEWGKSADTIRREADEHLAGQEALARKIFDSFAEQVRAGG
jgi:GMP synthase (glutamine-hydrolysing)